MSIIFLRKILVKIGFKMINQNLEVLKFQVYVSNFFILEKNFTKNFKFCCLQYLDFKKEHLNKLHFNFYY